MCLQGKRRLPQLKWIPDRAEERVQWLSRRLSLCLCLLSKSEKNHWTWCGRHNGKQPLNVLETWYEEETLHQNKGAAEHMFIKKNRVFLLTCFYIKEKMMKICCSSKNPLCPQHSQLALACRLCIAQQTLYYQSTVYSQMSTLPILPQSPIRSNWARHLLPCGNARSNSRITIYVILQVLLISILLYIT